YKPGPDDFQPIKVLGKGSFGKVLLVREKLTGRLFAQKQLKKSIILDNSKNVERIINENEILKKISNLNDNINNNDYNPFLVKLYYTFQDSTKIYFILEYLQGGELFSHLQKQRILSERNASFYVAEMLLALIHLHQKIGIVYRDLKPENCLLNQNGHLVLTDFGLSKFINENTAGAHSSDKCNTLTGTPQYMAPEILMGKPYDNSVDYWSLGCVVYDLLTGSPPFLGNNNKKIIDKVIKSKKIKYPFYLSLDAKDLLSKLLQKNPTKRMNDTKIDQLKKHRFFRYIDWNIIENNHLSLTPPIVPIITDPILAENFDSLFTQM
ncbi:kinase-like protein, partial [Ascoidea rubescens DSM 1968]